MTYRDIRRTIAGILVLLLVAAALVTGCAAGPNEAEEIVLGIACQPVPTTWGRGQLSSLPSYDPASTQGFQVDLRCYDLSGLDLTDRLTDLLQADFDTKTVWPEDLPTGFDPELFMELGRNPGLGLRKLHQTGITGQGVGVAIFDQPLLVDHVEYGERLRHYEERSYPSRQAQMHGPAVASIAVGETVGVAPGADLYYIAADGVKVRGLAIEAIERFLAINRILAPESRIRVISISVGLVPSRRLTRAVERAAAEGVLVISCGESWRHGVPIRYHGLDRYPTADPDNERSYGANTSFGFCPPPGGEGHGFESRLPLQTTPQPPPTILFVPMGSRCVASPAGPQDYVFYRVGGWSWCAPYIAGLYALACQVYPDIDPLTFYEMAMATGRPLDVSYIEPGTHGVVVDPVSLIESLKTLAAGG